MCLCMQQCLRQIIQQLSGLSHIDSASSLAFILDVCVYVCVADIKCSILRNAQAPVKYQVAFEFSQVPRGNIKRKYLV